MILKPKLNANIIKTIAILAMLADHLAWAFVATDSLAGCLLHTIGRITAPVMFFFLSEGYRHTHNLRNYLARLFLFSLISYVPYSLFANQWNGLGPQLSVISTLLCGLLALIVYDHAESAALKWILIGALILATFCMDWAFFGVLYVLAFGIFYGDRRAQIKAYGSVCLAQFLYKFLLYGFHPYQLIPVLVSPFFVLLLLRLYNGERKNGWFSKWSFYILYPLQFLIIGWLAWGR